MLFIEYCEKGIGDIPAYASGDVQLQVVDRIWTSAVVLNSSELEATRILGNQELEEGSRRAQNESQPQDPVEVSGWN